PAASNAIATQLRHYQRSGGRVTVIGRHARHPGDAVLPANEEGGYLAGDELYRLGHQRIGAIAGPRPLTTTTDRLTGLRRAARAYGHVLPVRRIAYAAFDRHSRAAAAAAPPDADPAVTAPAVLTVALAPGA